MTRSMTQLLCATLVLGAALATPQADAAPSSGSMAVVSSDGGSPLATGDSATTFSVDLPSGARCAGDSANDGYRLYSFLVPAGQDPSQLSFESTYPSRWYGMYTEAAYYAGLLDAGTGEVGTLPPDFTWTRLPVGDLIAARAGAATWTAGLMCVDGHYQDQNDWTTDFEFSRSATNPQAFTWRVLRPAAAPQTGSSYWLGVLPFLVAAALAVLAVVLHRGSRRVRRPRPLPAPTRRS